MEYPINNVEAENEHFEFSDSIISWMESCKVDGTFTKNTDLFTNILPSPLAYHKLSAPGLAWNLVGIFCQRQGVTLNEFLPNFLPIEKFSENNSQQQKFLCQNHGLSSPSPSNSQQSSPDLSIPNAGLSPTATAITKNLENSSTTVRMRGNDEWAPPRAQIIFIIHDECNFRKSMQRQNYLCAGCGTKIDLELARRLVLYCHYLGKYFCKCCFSHKAIHLPGYILQKWDFHKYPVSQFALQLVDKIANEPLFNINDINSDLYRRVKKLKALIDIRMQLYYLKIYISSCTQTDKLNGEFNSFTHQHLLADDVHLYSLNNLIEIQHGKLYEYLYDLVTRSIAHIAQCDRCRAKGHYCQLCGPSSLMSSMILGTGTGLTVSDNYQSSTSQNVKLKHSYSLGQNISNITNVINSGSSPPTTSAIIQQSLLINTNDHQLIFPFEIGRVAQCGGCGCCFHLQCFLDAGQNCPKCERIQRRKAETTSTMMKATEASTKTDSSNVDSESVDTRIQAT